MNGIVVLDSIPDGEFNTARRLKEDLNDIASYSLDGLIVHYIRIENIPSLEKAIFHIVNEIQTKALRPWIHLEAHGLSDESGFQLADRSEYSWEKWKNIITPLNIATQLNLVLVLALCFGGSFASAIRTTDRAPVLGLIGPTREVTVREIERGFSSFYHTLFKSFSFKEAIKTLNSTASAQYYHVSAERFFYTVWAKYKIDLCSTEEINKRARRMYRTVKKQKLPKSPSIGQLKRLIRSKEKSLFEEYRDKYFMYDIYTTNKDRFPVTYKKAESYVERCIR